jgi:hypothetical protein
VSGTGRSAVWRELSWTDKQVEPQYLIQQGTYERGEREMSVGPRPYGVLGFMDVSSATNARSMVASVVALGGCGNKVPTLESSRLDPTRGALLLNAVLGSLTYDFQLRQRFGGLSLNWFILAETALPRHALPDRLAGIVLRLVGAHVQFAPLWLACLGDVLPGGSGWRASWAVTEHERVRCRAIVEAVVAAAYGLTLDDFRHVIGECDLPRDRLRERSVTARLNPKGFWRVDQERDPELRLPVVSLFAFAALLDFIEAAGGMSCRVYRVPRAQRRAWMGTA